MQFVVRWPDDTVMACYSPSVIVRDYFVVGEAYAVSDFVERSTTALGIASERVREKFGFPCENALAQLSRIVSTAERFASDARVTIEGFS